jgi:hypothetical protein
VNRNIKFDQLWRFIDAQSLGAKSWTMPIVPMWKRVPAAAALLQTR